MSIATIVIGESGTGKSTALRNLDPKETLLIQAIPKPLPFKATKWTKFSKENPTGNIFVRDDSDGITNIMRKTQRKIIILDDVQYIMANEFMRRSHEKGFDKFNEIAKSIWNILNVANELADDVRVYMLWHSQIDDLGRSKVKTIGKLLDEKITIEGMVSIVLRTQILNGNYLFRTNNDGNDTTKSPLGMFESEVIENDLKIVDDEICNFYDITKMENKNES
tara:strand:+ start:1736 stop:2401 length:666 start_codon:yes stop_codon:yes gene_type:complete